MLRPVPFSWLLLLLLFDPPDAANADRHIEVVLTPRNYKDPRLMDNFTCGVDSSVDAERLIAEQNTIYIFETFLDKTKETDPNYKIKVFDVVTFSKDGKAENMLDNQLGKPDMEEPGLYTLFLSPPKAQCNTRTFEDAAEMSGEGYFPVYAGISGNFTEMINKFKGSSDNFKAFYNGVIPKLCGTKLKMKAETANSRKRILTKLFNFLFNGVERSLHPTHEKSCRSAHETISALTKDNLFMMGYDEIQFKGESQAVEEYDGFAKVIVMRNSSLDRKILGIVQTSFPTSSDDQCEPATSDDIVNFSNVIVFDVDETETDVYVTLKEDNILEEDECFFLNLVEFTDTFRNKTRVKRAMTDKEAKKEAKKLFKALIKGPNMPCEVENDPKCDGAMYTHGKGAVAKAAPKCWLPEPNKPEGVCVECLENAECTSFEEPICHNEKFCVVCRTDEECQSEGNNKPYCTDNLSQPWGKRGLKVCSMCDGDRDCKKHYQDDFPWCHPLKGCKKCLQDKHCNENGRQGECTEFKCATVGCTQNKECTKTEASVCGIDKECQSCVKNEDCAHLRGNPMCWHKTNNSPGFCGTCSIDDDCNGELTCSHGTCRVTGARLTYRFLGNGEWDRTCHTDHRNNMVVVQNNAIRFYKLVTTPSYTDRCSNIRRYSEEDPIDNPTIYNDGNTLPASEDLTWTSNDNISKWTRCALKILHWIIQQYPGNMAPGAQGPTCPNMRKQVMAIAVVRHEEDDDNAIPRLYLAGNLEDSFLNRGGGTDETRQLIKNDILRILDQEQVDYNSVQIIRPNEITSNPPGLKLGRSRKHAEMQIVQHIKQKNNNYPDRKLKIWSIHTSKTPCCACNSVLDKTVQGKVYYIPPFSEDQFQVVSPAGTDLCTNDQYTEHSTCGSQFHLENPDKKSDVFAKYWQHPREFGPSEEATVWPLPAFG